MFFVKQISKCIKVVFIGLMLMIAAPTIAADWFVVKKIEIQGALRIDEGAIYNNLPIKTGEIVDMRKTGDLVRSLYKTGFFDNVTLLRRKDTLIVKVKERAAIGSLRISGNKDISRKELLKALKSVGIAEGWTYNPTVLARMKQALTEQYYAKGKYNVKIKTNVTELSRNRVGLSLKIKEGGEAKIQAIDIIGNQAFTDKQLKSQFNLTTQSILTYFSSRDVYAKEKLEADLEALRAYYLNRGFLRFKIDSHQVSLSDDKKAVFITINISEGRRYALGHLKLQGKTIVPKDVLLKLITVKTGDIFSRETITKETNAMAERLADEGYAFANIHVIPDIDDNNHKVDITFLIEPGKRVYVNQIHFSGNAKTQEQVLRREVTQMEGGWLSATQLKRSKTNLQRLGYISQADISTQKVTSDFPQVDAVDVLFKVTEQPAGQLTGGVNYSEVDGMGFNLGVHQNNFLGTGKTVGLDFNHSKVYTLYNINYFNPYYTLDGIGRGISAYYNTTNLRKASVGAHYALDSYGASLSYAIPLSADDTLSAVLGLNHSHLQLRNDPAAISRELSAFEKDYGNNYTDATISLSWLHNTFDRAIFPHSGLAHRMSLFTTVPGSTLQYFKLSTTTAGYWPFYKSLIFTTRAGLAYGNGYGKTRNLPFFENFFAGGLNSVRGFTERSLGPRDSKNEVLGGNFKLNASIAVIFPIPFIESDAVRASLFLDGGNVYNLQKQGVKFDEVRYSTGVSIEWFTPMGPLVFSLAKPFNNRSGDKLRTFDFTIGTPFGG